MQTTPSTLRTTKWPSIQLLHRTVPPAQTAEGSLGDGLPRARALPDPPLGRAPPDAHAEATLRVLLDRTGAALAEPGDVAARTDLALATASSVRGFAGLGRSRYGDRPVVPGNALALGHGATKGRALAPLLRVQVQRLAGGGELPPALGHPRRLARFGAAVLGTAAQPAEAAAALWERIDGWGLPRGLGAIDVAALVAETRRLWDGEPLAGPTDADLRALYEAAA